MHFRNIIKLLGFFLNLCVKCRGFFALQIVKFAYIVEYFSTFYAKYAIFLNSKKSMAKKMQGLISKMQQISCITETKHHLFLKNGSK